MTPTPRSGGGNPNPNPVVSPAQAFAITVLQRDQPIESNRWEYYERHLIEVRISTTSDSVRMEDYNFMLDLNSEQTGIYMVRAGPGNATCDENRLGDTETNTVEGPTIFLLGIRCGLGEPGGHFEVRAQRDNSGNSPMYSIGRTGAIPQPWHLLDGRANYYFQIADPVGSRVYGIPPEYYYDGAAALLERTTRAATLDWDFATGIPIFHVEGPYDFVVKTFWATRNPCPTGRAYACVVPFQSGEDPHMTDLNTLWVRYPPNWYDSRGDPTQWTDNPDHIIHNRDQDTYYYLPYVMVHELGHTTGLPHMVGEHIMEEGYPKKDVPAKRTLSPSEIYIMKQSVSSHSHR